MNVRIGKTGRRRLLTAVLAIALAVPVGLIPRPALAANDLYLHAGLGTMDAIAPVPTVATLFPMTNGNTMTWNSSVPYAGQTILAATTFSMTHWTTLGTASSATVTLTFGYAATTACTGATTIATGAGIAVTRTGPKTTTTFTPGANKTITAGSYLCWTILVTGGIFTHSLNYDATVAPTAINSSQALILNQA